MNITIKKKEKEIRFLNEKQTIVNKFIDEHRIKPTRITSYMLAFTTDIFSLFLSLCAMAIDACSFYFFFNPSSNVIFMYFSICFTSSSSSSSSVQPSLLDFWLLEFSSLFSLIQFDAVMSHTRHSKKLWNNFCWRENCQRISNSQYIHSIDRKEKKKYFFSQYYSRFILADWIFVLKLFFEILVNVFIDTVI